MDFVQGYGAEDDAEGGSQEIELDVFVNHLTGDIDVRQQGAEEEERRDALAGTTCAAPTSAPPRAPKASQCEVCKEAEAKYTCPGCSARSCSAACVRAHKEATGCSGKRDRTAFVALQEFSDRELRSDFGLLEDVKRVADNAHRHKPPVPRELPPALATLKYQAAQRQVELLLQQPLMERRKKNSSRYDHRQRLLSWRIEWRFHGTAVVCEDAQVPETTSLRSVLTPHLALQLGEGDRRFALREFAEAGPDQLTVVLRKERCPADQPQFLSIQLDATLAEQLAGKCIVEFPVFTVLLPRDVDKFTIVEADPNAVRPMEVQGGRHMHGGGGGRGRGGRGGYGGRGGRGGGYHSGGGRAGRGWGRGRGREGGRPGGQFIKGSGGGGGAEGSGPNGGGSGNAPVAAAGPE